MGVVATYLSTGRGPNRGLNEGWPAWRALWLWMGLPASAEMQKRIVAKTHLQSFTYKCTTVTDLKFLKCICHIDNRELFATLQLMIMIWLFFPYDFLQVFWLTLLNALISGLFSFSRKMTLHIIWVHMHTCTCAHTRTHTHSVCCACFLPCSLSVIVSPAADLTAEHFLSQGHVI